MADTPATAVRPITAANRMDLFMAGSLISAQLELSLTKTVHVGAPLGAIRGAIRGAI
jgi:hypothetical protein